MRIRYEINRFQKSELNDLLPIIKKEVESNENAVERERIAFL